MKNITRIFIFFFTVSTIAFSQVYTEFSNLNENLNTITTAVPFITITPDSRAGSMGEVGVATTADLHSLHWNPAKLAFLEKKSGVAVSYTPWLAALIPEINLSYLTGYSKINDNSTWSAALRYFTLGQMTVTNDAGDQLGVFEPKEFTFDLGYGMKFNNNLSGGIAMRFINSNLTEGQTLDNGVATEAGRSFAVDLSTYYESDFLENNQWAVGLNISNIGSKISYTETEEADFLPTTLKLGGRYTMKIDDYNTFSVSMDLNKYLVPSPPVYLIDSLGTPVLDGNGDQVIFAGQDPNVSVISGMFQSFGDAPGGITEEWRELIYCLGFEWWYNNQFAFRGGYFHEHELKGNRQYFTLGAGLKMNVFAIDFSYLITATPDTRSPLENTVRFSLAFDLGAFNLSNPESEKNIIE
tara:strand:+ start:877 stop:2109 length:1233 start_codon:yes stop_codon:yes gene_type:complete